MHVSEFMTTKVIIVSSDDSIARAARLMYAHKVRRLPVVDNGEIVGIIGEKMIAAAMPSAATSLSAPETAGSVSKLNVGQLMHKDVVTVTTDTTAETALGIAQQAGVGALVVVDNKGQLAGIITTNDFFYKIVNPLLGMGKPGTRLHIYNCCAADTIAEVMTLIKKHGLDIVIIHSEDSIERNTVDLVVQVDTEDISELIRELNDRGFKAVIRKRLLWPTAEVEAGTS